MLRLDDLADSIADKSKMGDLAKTSKAAESKVGDYLAVIARCFELQDALDCLRLDRVRDKSPAELDARRLSLRVDRDKRRDRTAHQVGQLLTSQGTVYPLLNRLSEAGLISDRWDLAGGSRPRRYYELTPAGADHLRTFSTDWTRFSRSVDELLARAAATRPVESPTAGGPR